MLRSYVTIALRNILRNKVYSTINIAGLALGLACCLLLALYIFDEIGYDKHHQRVDDLYRITTQFESDKGIDRLGTTSPPIAPTLKEEIPEIEAAARMLIFPGVAQSLIKHNDNSFYERDGYIADSSIFQILTYEFVEGNAKTALREANSIVITDRLSIKLFGNEQALDKVITVSQGTTPVDFKVTGVIKETTKTFAHANFFTSMTSDGLAAYLRSKEARDEWAGQNFVPSFVKLVQGHDVNEVIRKMNQVLVKYGAEDMKALGMTKQLGLEPVKDIYLKSEIDKSVRITYIYVIASIAVFILLIACINFMNLSTARATQRANEIGVRKVMGAFKSSLVSQILGEALVIVLSAMVLSVVLLQLALPYFNQFTGKMISFQSANAGFFAAALACTAIVTGLLAGSYPAFYLSSFQPAQVLKGKMNISNSTGWLRRTLVVFQFMIAIILVCGMLIISRQLHFMQNRNLGFNAEAKVVLPLRTKTSRDNYEVVKNELIRSSSVKNASGAFYAPGTPILNDMFFYKEGGNMNTAIMHFRNGVDYDFMDVLNIPIIAGRKFNANRDVDSESKVIINRTSARQFGFTPEEAVGQKLYYDWQGERFNFEVIGVMEDYHHVSLKTEIKPIMYYVVDNIKRLDVMIATVNTTDFEETISTIEKTWKSLVPDTPFEYTFLDQNLAQQYDEDRKVARIITSFTIIAMFISCLGLYGLSTYMAEKRFKEIGVRKVMGASVKQIVQLMSTEFLKLVLIALALSIPLAWYVMNQWLEGFAYRVTIDATVFIYAGVVALLIALFTISFESIRAATGDPVKALRNE